MDARYKIAEAMMRGVGQPMAAFPDQRQDDDMALRGMASDLYQADQKRAQDYRAGIKEAILQSWPAELAKSAYGAATLPGDVYAGKVNPMSDEAVGRSAELAGLMTLGAGGVPAGRNEMRMGIKAYHGSPHDFPAERLVRFPDGRTDYIVGKPDVLPIVPPKAEIIQDFPLGRFRMDKIGTGEGAQAYGHGLYAADKETLAKSYRDTLKNAYISTNDGNIDRGILFDNLSKSVRAADSSLSLQQSDAIARNMIDGVIDAGSIKKYLSEYDLPSGPKGIFKTGYETAARELQNKNARAAQGRMYEVELNTTPDRLLDWDKPLSGQNPIRSLIGDLGQQYANAGSAEARNVARDAFMAAKNENLTGAGVYNQLTRLANTGGAIGEHLGPLSPRMMSGPSVASQTLRKEAGIDGIKYLDAGSRAAGDGSRNYVMFDDKLIQILRKYGVATAAALPAAALAELGMSREEAKRSF